MRPRAAATLFLILLALPACDFSSATNTSPVSGEWLAVALEVESVANPDSGAVLIPDGGWFRYVSLGSGGYYEDTRWSPGGGWENQSGSWQAGDTEVVIDFGGANTPSQRWDYELVANERIRITVSLTEGYDFNGDGTGEPTIETVELVRSELNPDPDLLGTWVAQSYTFTSVADNTVEFDVIAEGGNLVITLLQTARYQVSETLPGSSGTTSDFDEYAAADGLFWLMDGGTVDFATYTVVGNTLTLRFAEAAWDFDGDDVDEDATLELVLTR